MSVVSPQWPMTTRVRSTPSSAKMACCSSPRLVAACVCVEIGTPVCRCACGDGAQHPLDPWRHAGFVGGALEDRRLDAGVGDAVLDVADEHLDHGLGSTEWCAGPEVVEVHRHVVVGVQAGGDDDVQLGGRGDARDARKVAAQPDDGEVDDGVDAAGLEFVQPDDRVGFALGAVAPAPPGSSP